MSEDRDAAYPRSPADADTRSVWASSFGVRWRVDLAVMALVVFCFGAVRPLSDPDLPMHLAIGEWIVAHRAVPLVEPFAWTRAGAPYYAYSWLPQTAFYVVFDALGPLGLRALQGFIVLGIAASAVALSRAAGWRPGQAVMMGGFNLIVGAFFVALLRPQAILLITIPLIWAAFYTITRRGQIGVPALILFVASALTANSHLFFPLTLAPAVLLWVYPPTRWRHGAIGVASVVAGWFLSPYSVRWLDVFRHNFASNALMRPPSAITELQPGFVTMLYPSLDPMIVLVAGMLAVPWVLTQLPMHQRERVLAAVYWSAGLALFGFAVRMFMAWWLLALVPVGWALIHLTRNTEEAPPRLRFRLLGLFGCSLIVAAELSRTVQLSAMEGSTTRRTLPTFGALPAEHAATWLAQNTGPQTGGKLMTTFSYGSYLTWRLPAYSASIDSRGIFPDSIVAAEAIVGATDRDVPLGPWRSADVAILPVKFRVAATLDTAAMWRRAAAVPGSPNALDSTGVWVKREWWARNGRTPTRP